MTQGAKEDLGLGAKGIQLRKQELETQETVEIVLGGGEHFKVGSSHVQKDVEGLYLADSTPIMFFFLGSYHGKAVGDEIIVPPAVLQRIKAKR